MATALKWIATSAGPTHGCACPAACGNASRASRQQPSPESPWSDLVMRGAETIPAALDRLAWDDAPRSRAEQVAGKPIEEPQTSSNPASLQILRCRERAQPLLRRTPRRAGLR